MTPRASENVLQSARAWILFAAFFAVSTGGVIHSLNAMDWWKWKKSEQDFVRLIRTMPHTLESMEIIEAEPNPRAYFERVIGNDEALPHLWLMFHPETAKFKILHTAPSEPGEPPAHQARVRWTLDAVEII